MPNGDGVDSINGITVVPKPTRERLNQRQVIDYRGYRQDFIEWMHHFGKDPDRAKGYALSTVNRRACDCDLFMRHVWDERGRYTTQVTERDAESWLRELATSERSTTDKANKLKSMKMLMRYHDIEDWDPPFTFDSRTRDSPPDYLTREERTLVREAALEFGTVPAPSSLSKAERAEWDRYLAMRQNKPAKKISEQDYRQANGMKYPSLVWASIDAGLRPIEVNRARTHWVDVENGVLRIPQSEDTKGEFGDRDNWTVALRDQTARFLDQWLAERQMYEKYEESDRLWLTRHGNPYTWRGLKYILNELCDIVDIETENRKMTWYAIRHSTGTYMAENSSLEATRVQLRRKTVPREYDNTPVEERRETLDDIG